MKGMKKYFAVGIVLLLSFAGYYLSDDFSFDQIQDLTGALTNSNEEVQGTTTYSIQSEGDIEVFFCPDDDCETIMLETIGLAQESLHCAFYELSYPLIQDLVLEKYEHQDVETQIVVDDHYLERFPYEKFVTPDRSGQMHNKFCIIDSQIVTTGSMNPTVNGITKNNNNLIIINSPELAANYENEFQEMYTDLIFKKGDPVPTTNILLQTTNNEGIETEIEIENYFCPDDDCADHIVEELQSAKKSIYFMTFSFTHDSIGNNILLKYEDGLDIQGVFEARQAGSEYSKYHLFEYQELDITKDGNPNNMHHKTFIIDGETVITGSMNPSNNGDKRNDENILIIHSKDIAKQFIEEFEKVKLEALG